MQRTQNSTRLLVTALVAITLIFSFLSESVCASDETPVLNGARIDTGPRIDGSLNDAQWQRAQWFSDFRQSVPEFGKQATERTEVAFLYDENNFYIGVRCLDSNPDSIIARHLRHRSGIGADDNVAVVLDTFQDQQRAFMFMVNPLGAKSEAQVTGNHSSDNWEDVWSVASQISDQGWEAEFRIPFRVLRFASGDGSAWNVNVKREIQRKREEVYIVPPDPPNGITYLNYHAELVGLDLKPNQRNIQFIPYAIGGAVITDDETDETGDIGFDAKYSITSNLTLDLTYNTDFAQVEADNEQINLTRYSLFFPEKRDFFLENAQLFEFGGYGGGGGRFLPFFSRRIGLHQGQTVPIDFGARLTGKVGQQDVGIISMRTASVDEANLDDAFYNVVRIKRALQGRSFIGMLLTDSRRGDFSSTTFGGDISYWVDRRLELSGHLLTVQRDHFDEDNYAWKTSADFTTDEFGFLITHSEIGQNFKPDLGYVRQTGVRDDSAFFRFSRRPDFEWLRRWSLRFNNSYSQILDGVMQSTSNSVRYEMEFETGDELNVQYAHSFERLFDEFDISDNIVFGPGDYSFDEVSVDFETSGSRQWGVELGASYGSFYDADRRDMGAEFAYTFNMHFAMEAEISNYDISTDYADENWTILGLSARYTFTSNFDISSFVQYNSESGDLIVNLRAHLIYGDDSDFYIVFNERRFEDRFGDFRLENRQALVKINYRYFF